MDGATGHSRWNPSVDASANTTGAATSSARSAGRGSTHMNATKAVNSKKKPLPRVYDAPVNNRDPYVQSPCHTHLEAQTIYPSECSGHKTKGFQS